MSEEPANWLSAWATTAGTLVAIAAAIYSGIGARRSKKAREKAEQSAAESERSARRSAEAQERMAAALEAQLAAAEQARAIVWKVESGPTDGTGTVFKLVNAGGGIARGVTLRGEGQFAGMVNGWAEPIVLAGGQSQPFRVGRRFSMPLPQVRVFWDGNPKGVMIVLQD